MGRRARTNNCSPIDSAMEKYHNDIGNRLSGVFMPTLPKTDSGDAIASDFCMLTLDTRHLSSVRSNKHKDTPTRPKLAQDSFDKPSNPSPAKREEMLGHTEESVASERSSSPCTVKSTFSSTHSEHETPKEKKGLVDKLTRALFQRKHTCSRCQRRSRSCLPNKNFNGTEKHYMCGNCRENAYAIKNLFNGLSTLNTDSGISSGTPSSNTSPMSVCSREGEKQHIPQPRTQLKDSGYDTVTSCSTVASAYSAFNTPESQEKFAKTQNNTGVSYNNSNNNVKSTQQVFTKPKGDAATENYYQDNLVPELYNQLVVVGQHHDLPGGVLRQVKTRHIKDYDGYLPTTHSHHHHQQQQHHHHHHQEPARHHTTRQPLSDTTNSTNSFCDEVSNSAPSVKNVKACHVCGTSSKPCFRLPWEGGWLCEDCIDGML